MSRAHRVRKLLTHRARDGWADVKELIDGVNQAGGHFLDTELLEEIVRIDEKQRYSFNEDHTLIRANQGAVVRWTTLRSRSTDRAGRRDIPFP